MSGSKERPDQTTAELNGDHMVACPCLLNRAAARPTTTCPMLAMVFHTMQRARRCRRTQGQPRAATTPVASSRSLSATPASVGGKVNVTSMLTVGVGVGGRATVPVPPFAVTDPDGGNAARHSVINGPAKAYSTPHVCGNVMLNAVVLVGFPSLRPSTTQRFRGTSRLAIRIRSYPPTSVHAE